MQCQCNRDIYIYRLDPFMTSAEHFISLITVTSAKKLATALVVCFIIYHSVIHLIYGKYSGNVCKVNKN